MLRIIIQRRVPFTELSSEAARASAVPPDHQSSLELHCSCDCAGVLQLNLCIYILQQKATGFHEWACFLFCFKKLYFF